MTSDLAFMTEGTLLIEHLSYFGYNAQTFILCHPTKSLPQTEHTATFLHPSISKK